MKGVFVGADFSVYLLQDASSQYWCRGGQCLFFDIVGTKTHIRVDSFSAKFALLNHIGKAIGKEE